jgi:ubiquinone biosynthesis protein
MDNGFKGGLPIFEKRIRHIKRYREIAVAFSRNGFGFVIKELGLHELIPLPKRLTARQEQKHSKTTGERVRLFLEELGPTFVKMGQFASTRSDLIPEDITKELSKLQDQVPPFSSEEAKAVIEQELGTKIDDIFQEFDDQPLGSASIGQVHYAVLKSGDPVAVKVQRPNIKDRIKTDLEILKQLAVLAEYRLEWAERYDVKEIVEEFAKALAAELDYTVEGRNGDRIAGQFADDPHIDVPGVFWDFTTKKVLTMEYISGTKLTDIGLLARKGFNAKVLAERIANAIFHQIFIEGFFHGDPHPGNISARSGDSIVFMDFGMTGRLTRDTKDAFADLVISLMRQNTDGIIKAIMKMGVVPDDADIQMLTADVDLLRDKYYDIPFSQVSIGEAVNDLLSVAHAHYIQIPANMTLLGKALVTMEGTVERLDPDISIVKVAQPFGRQLLKERYRPKRMAEHLFNQWVEMGGVLTDMPKNLRDIAAMVKKGKLPVEISIAKADMFLHKLDRISNRLSFSIVLLSFSIIMVGLIIGSALGGQSSILWNIPAVEIGFGVATLMFLWLLFSIFRSGRF